MLKNVSAIIRCPLYSMSAMYRFDCICRVLRRLKSVGLTAFKILTRPRQNFLQFDHSSFVWNFFYGWSFLLSYHNLQFVSYRQTSVRQVVVLYSNDFMEIDLGELSIGRLWGVVVL